MYGKQLKIYGHKTTIQFQYISVEKSSLETIRIEVATKNGDSYNYADKVTIQLKRGELYEFVEFILNFNLTFKTASHDGVCLYGNTNDNGVKNLIMNKGEKKLSHNLTVSERKEVALFVSARAASEARMSVTDLLNVLKLTQR
ncbi:hypothetical protein [Photobacterium sp. GB-72]|uniref:hypothetical protein n=1 Tax=Photobacterium sp. GB-72 TaxID=2022105 RepID=UPI000D16A5FC|nr:hypothetical protein [Photobacterium sp. GB-72]PSV28086.1 hypothetical protein C9J40_19595 [Photobacterium sp. GB-72]